MSKFDRLIAPLVLVAVTAIVGCSEMAKVEDPAVVAQRNKLVLAEEPQGAISIADARKDIEKGKEVVVIGKVGAGDSPPWELGKMAFLISENGTANAHDHDSPGHDAENCPFCKRRKKLSTAMVQFVDQEGHVLPIDARELLGVKENQVVVVKGLAKLNDLDMLVVTADGIHLR